MTEIRTKDKLFLAVVLPAALVALYVWGWRTAAVKRLRTLEAQDLALVAQDAFPQEKRTLELNAAAARKEREEALSAPMPAVRVKGEAGASPAERERTVVGVFRTAGLRVTKIESGRSSDKVSGEAGEALKATGVCPEPVRRVYRLDGGYPSVRQALDAFAGNEMAVAVEQLSMEGNGNWSVSIYE
ncbi:MAG: hypothetical protein J6Z49_05060 [Kiritimatiellae bacterium]|nr:hypothetical protein [Kiritimatiellia bacterium]